MPSDASSVRRAGGVAAVVVLTLTLTGVTAAILDPGLAGSSRPHPTLTGSLGDWLSILSTNLRVLAVPFLLAALRLPATRAGRTIGDLILATLTALSTLSVGIAIGRWRGRLIPYLPHLPAEWAALTLALAAWLLIRTGHAPVRQLAGLAAVITGLLIAAASLEAWATPHRPVPAGAPHMRAESSQTPRADGTPLMMPARAPTPAGSTPRDLTTTNDYDRGHASHHGADL